MFGRDPLDDILGYFGRSDPLIVRDLLRSVSVFGQTGSGKSSGSGLMMARAIVKYRNSGGLILASKPEDRDWWQGIFAAAGRKNDLLILEPDGPYQCNILDHEMKHGADTREIVQFMMTVAETLNRSGGQSQEPFWVQQQRRQLFNAVEIVKLATGKLDPWELQVFINSAPTDPAVMAALETIEDAGTRTRAQLWRSSFNFRCMSAAHAAAKTVMQQHDYQLAKEYWLGEMPKLNDRTKSSITAGVMGLLHVYNTGQVRHLLASATNLSPDVMERRKWIMVNMPVVAGDGSATFVNAAMKYAIQRHILRRKAGRDDPILGIYCDEFPKVTNAYDTAFLAECRSHKGYLVALMQSLPGLCDALGHDGKNKAIALLSNSYIRIFHVLGDSDTAQFASSLLGQKLRVLTGGSTGPQQGVGDQLFGQSTASTSFNQTWEPILQPNVFMGSEGLRTGGKANRYKVDGIIVREGNFRFVTFDQRR